MKCNTRDDSIQWQISTCIKVTPEHFSLALTVYKIFSFQNCDRENVGQSHGVQHSMANTRLRNWWQIVMYVISSIYLSKWPREKFYLENLGQGHWLQHSQLCPSLANINLDTSYNGHFVLALTVCEILFFETFDLENLGQGHVVEIWAYAIR